MGKIVYNGKIEDPDDEARFDREAMRRAWASQEKEGNWSTAADDSANKQPTHTVTLISRRRGFSPN